MKITKSNTENLLITEICEEEYSKQTIANIIFKLKPAIEKPIITVKDGKIYESKFSSITNSAGCIALEGGNISGVSLFNYFLEYKNSGLDSKKSEELLELLIEVSSAVQLVKREKNYFPKLYLNSVFIDRKTNSVSFIPVEIASTLHDYIKGEARIINGFCVDNLLAPESVSEDETVKSLVILLYLGYLLSYKKTESTFKKKTVEIKAKPVYYLKTLNPGAPKNLADYLWRILKKGQKSTIEQLISILQMAISASKEYKYKEDLKREKIPFLRGKKWVDFSFNLKNTIYHRWKFLIIVSIIAGFFIYIVGDIIYRSTLSKITEGMSPEEVVQLYVKALKDLDVETINDIFYKRTGKQVFKEVSSLFVIKRMTQIYGFRWITSNQLKNMDIKNLKKIPKNANIYAILNVKVEKVSDKTQPVFRLTYKKILSNEDNIDIYEYSENLTLIKIKGRWYIGKFKRRLLKHEEIKR